MHLPPSVLDFVRVIGLGATLRLADCACPYTGRRKRESHRDGYRIRVPKGGIPDSHALVQTIGRENAEMLQRHFGGEVMPFPARRIRAIKRDLNIARDYQAGIGIPTLASTYSVSERTVLRAIERMTTGDVAQASGHRGRTAPNLVKPCRVTRFPILDRP